jgi:predicted acyltransferase (DUF342 family)
VLVGGDAHGQGEVRTASGTFVSGDSRIHADALTQGDGGKVVVWADGATRSYGAISARGGAASGNGGFVETSGRRYLEVSDAPDLSAPKGKGGAWLLDPANITIRNTLGNLDPLTPDFTADEASSTVSDDAIEAALNTGADVTISTDVDLGADNESGDIVQEADARIEKTSGADATLSLLAANDIVLNGGVETRSGALSVKLVADRTTLPGDDGQASDPSPFVGSLEVNADIRTGGGSATLDASTAIDINAEIDTAGGAATLGLNSASGSQIRISNNITTAGGTLRLARNTILDGADVHANQSLDAGSGKLRTSGTLTKTTAGDLALAGGAEIRLQGDVDVTLGSLTLDADSVEAAELTASNNIAILGVSQGVSEVFGDVRAGADVEITTFANVSGSIIAGGAITLEGVATQSIQAGGDVDVGGLASVEGTITAGGDIDLSEFAGVNGSLNAGDDILINGLITVGGDAVAGNNVEVNEEFIVGGDIDAENDVLIGSLTTITGSVIAGNDIEVDEELSVGGDLNAGNDVFISSFTTITGSLIAGNDIQLDEEIELEGDIIAGNDLVIDTLIEIDGNVFAKNDVEVNDEFAVGGDLEAGNDVMIGSFTTISGDLMAGRDVLLNAELELDGDILAGNDVVVDTLIEIDEMSSPATTCR